MRRLLHYKGLLKFQYFDTANIALHIVVGLREVPSHLKSI